MSKNSSQKSKQKLKKRISDNNSKRTNTEKARNSFLNATQREMEEKIKPTKNKTVIFKGLTQELIHSEELKASIEANELSLPLEDFYAEVKIYEKKLKLHWIPLKSSIERAALYDFFASRFKENQLASSNNATLMNGTMVKDMQTLGYKEKHAIAIVYANFEGIYYLGCVMANKESKKLNIFPIANKHMLNSINETEFPKVKAGAMNFARSLFVRHVEELSKCALAIQHIVGLYLEGKELPKITLSSKEQPHDITDHSASTREKSASKPKGKDPDGYLAYIRYDIEDGTLKISNSSKNYEMKWWIVSGHKRHYQSGKVTDVRPYIKGDKDDPQAQKALEEFIEGYERTKIKFYQLVANRAK